MVRPSRLNGGGTVPFVIVSDCPRPSRLFLLSISIGYRHLSSLMIPFAFKFLSADEMEDEKLIKKFNLLI